MPYPFNQRIIADIYRTRPKPDKALDVINTYTFGKIPKLILYIVSCNVELQTIYGIKRGEQEGRRFEREETEG
jgi:hypothetical protein